MKQVTTPVITFLITHIICCGTLLFFLISSGYLLVLYNIGAQKQFIIPSLIVVAVTIWWYRRFKKYYELQNHKTFGQQVALFALYFLCSLIISILFIVYFFIPWWIPGYEGGPLLP